MRDLYAEKRKEAIAQVTEEQREAIRVIAKMVIDKMYSGNTPQEELEMMYVDTEQAFLKACSSSVFSFMGVHVRRRTADEGPLGYESCIGRLYTQPAMKDGEDEDLGRLVPHGFGMLLAALLAMEGSADMSAGEMQEMFASAAAVRMIIPGLGGSGDDGCDGDCVDCLRPDMPEA